jgi:hypothetical protein
MNVRGCGRVEKQDLIQRMITEKGFDICPLSETKLKGSGEFMIGSIKGMKAGVGERCRAREGVAIMLSERMWSMASEGMESSIVTDCVAPTEMWVIVSAYRPGSEKAEDEREEFWKTQ